MSKRYSEVTEGDLQAMAQAWDGQCRFSRHAIHWLAEQGFNWDPAKTDDENRADFEQIEDDALVIALAQ